MVDWVAGDLFAADLPAIGHGVNCAAAMGRGIAVEFRRRWPDMFEEYRTRCRAGSLRPGDVFVWRAPDRVIFNLATQQTWRTPATLSAIETSLSRTLDLCSDLGVDRIGLPRIGAGLGGLVWSDVRAVIERVATRAQPRLVVFETFSP